MSTLTTCPNCGHCLKTAKRAAAKAQGALFIDAIEDQAHAGFYINTTPAGKQFGCSFPISAKEWKADYSKREKMRLKFGTDARNAALLAIGRLPVADDTAQYIAVAKAKNAPRIVRTYYKDTA
jgi:hypothetical protein